MNLPRLLRSLLLLGLAFGQAESFGGTFRVSPVQVFLGEGGGSALITIYNEGDKPVRFQISATSWTQSETGEMQLRPAEEILFFPKLLEVAPGGQRNVRVACTERAADVEKTYRLFFDELPPAPVPGQGATVNVITKMGVPIFITPSGAAPRIETEASVSAGVLHVTVSNRGSSHATLQEVRVRGLGADGAEAFTARKDGWYLLARSVRRYEFPLGERCATVANFSIEAVFTTPATAEPERAATTLMPGAAGCE